MKPKDILGSTAGMSGGIFTGFRKTAPEGSAHIVAQALTAVILIGAVAALARGLPADADGL